MKAIIVEDSEPMIIVLEHTLKEIGVDVVGKAQTGKEAIELAIALQPDIITLDTVLPDIIGIEVLKALKKSNVTSKVIFISAAGSELLIEEALKAGADDYLLKPINAEKIKEKINSLK